MDPYIDGPRVSDLHVAHVATYCRLHGWTRIAHPNPAYLVFTGPADAQGDPLELVLPAHGNPHTGDYITMAVTLLAALAGVDPPTLTLRIQQSVGPAFQAGLIDAPTARRFYAYHVAAAYDRRIRAMETARDQLSAAFLALADLP
jgi:hypothetical protein